jgi:hypothetical protein
MYSFSSQGYPDMLRSYSLFTIYVDPAVPPINVFIKCFSKMYLRPGAFPTIFSLAYADIYSGIGAFRSVSEHSVPQKRTINWKWNIKDSVKQ